MCIKGKTFTKYRIMLLTTCFVLLLLSGCGNRALENPVPQTQMPVQMEQKLLAFGEANQADGNKVTIQLIMTKGEWYTEDHAGAGGGTYPENYSGFYRIDVLDEEGALLDSREINQDFKEEGEKLNFPGSFQLQLADYNGDGNIDFSIGQYGSSSMNLFYLYSVTDDGRIELISEEIPAASKDFSMVFEQSPEEGICQLEVPVWNNALGQEETVLYSWEEAAGLFIQGSKEPVTTREKQDIMGIWGYTGYLDECSGYMGYESFVEQDYDQDGRPDRVYRQMQDKGEMCNYRIEFGNGDMLTLDRAVWDTGFPAIQAADLTGNGFNEIIFTLSYDTSTNPRAFGDLAIFEKTGNEYVRSELPFILGEESYSQCLSFTYRVVKEHVIEVTCEEADFIREFDIDEDSWNAGSYAAAYDGTTNEKPVYDAVVTEKNGKPILICRIELFDKYVGYEAVAAVGYANGAFQIEEVE